jgi:transcription initiation factor TFIIH subunit 4
MHLLEGKEKKDERVSIFDSNFDLYSGMQQSFGLPCSAPDKHAVDIGYLDHYATTQWEAILHYMVGTSLTKKPSRGVLNLLERSKLMQSR